MKKTVAIAAGRRRRRAVAARRRCALRSAAAGAARDALCEAVAELPALACKNGHDAAAGLLIRRGALQDPEAQRGRAHDVARGSAPCLELILESDLTAPQAGAPDLLDAADASGNTALMVAASLGNAEAATSLLRAGADADLYNNDQTASTMATGAACASFASPAERFWNASAAGNRAWRRVTFRVRDGTLRPRCRAFFRGRRRGRAFRNRFSSLGTQLRQGLCD